MAQDYLKMPDLEQIRRNYEAFDDAQIEHIANYEAGALEPEVVSILPRLSRTGPVLDLLSQDLKVGP